MEPERTLAKSTDHEVDRKCFVATACTQSMATKPGLGLCPDTPMSDARCLSPAALPGQPLMSTNAI